MTHVFLACLLKFATGFAIGVVIGVGAGALMVGVVAVLGKPRARAGLAPTVGERPPMVKGRWPS